MTLRFSAIDPSEDMVLTFDFSLGLLTGESLSGSPTVTVTVDFGTDPNASAIVKASTISGSTVLVAVAGGLDQTDYHIHCLCPTSNPQKELMTAGILPVRVQ